MDIKFNIVALRQQLTTKITLILITNQIIWPNGIVAADQLVEYSMIVPSGFLIPGKNKENLYVISDTNAIPLVPDDKSKWFYHDAEFKDMDGDGFIDIVSEHVNIPFVGKSTTQLVWLKNPGNQTITGPWKLYYLLSNGGPDIQVQFARDDSLQIYILLISIKL
ncbi:unnamed protein product [Rotaria sp. Silwood2]|nr:unnamed protein product [Rotaria sp. Silwood2]